MVQLQADSETLNELGFRIVAVCIDPPEVLAKTAVDWGLGMPLLSDPELKLAHAYGVAFRPEGRPGLPVPAVFLVTEGRVRFQYVNPTYQVRLAREVLLAAARELSPRRQEE